MTLIPDHWWVIGIGADYRGDDGFGHWVVDALASGSAGGSTNFIKLNDISRLLYFSAPERSLLIVDAVRSSKLPVGEVIRCEFSAESLQKERVQTSTHSLGLAEALELTQVMGQFPRKVVFFGVVGSRFGIGDRPSSQVLDRISPIANEVAARICCHGLLGDGMDVGTRPTASNRE